MPTLFLAGTLPTVSDSKRVPLVDLPRQHRDLLPELQPVIADLLSSGRFIGGPEVSAFEEAFSTYCEASHTISVNSGTAALQLILWALEVGPGDEVILPAFTFVATAEAVCAIGAQPVLADIDPATLTLDPAATRAAVTPKTRAIIPVHLYGQPAEMEPLLDLARAHQIHLIEDACQAHGARWNGKRVGALGTAGAFSFYPAKNLGAPGDGGAITTNNSDLAQKVRALSNHGRGEGGWYEHSLIGGTYRLNTIPAVFLSANLPHLDPRNERRRRAANIYRTHLKTIEGVEPLFCRENCEPVYHQFVIRCQRREDLRNHLDAAGIDSAIHYPAPLHQMGALKFLGYKEGDFPISERASQEVLSLPMHPYLEDSQIERVVESIHRFFSVPSR
ncbi:MAG: DegT/DnrJ/EryC1/StrS family aminotransferase [Planctomycetota bacterium]|nr:DegT/DnrJ/EryC1/StrS family aminotransferase [Planctomycetota bacterium]